jgi:integrase/recombinase XerC
MSLTTQLLIDQFLAWAQPRLQPGTVENYRRLLARFVKIAGPGPAGELKKSVLLSWGKTWHEIQAVQRLFNWACNDAEILERNPFRTIKRPPLGERKRILDRRTEVMLRRGSSPAFRHLLLCLGETIGRPQEARTLQWENVWWAGKPIGTTEALAAGDGVFQLHDYKSRRRRSDPNKTRSVPITPRLGRLLARLCRGKKELTGPIFLNSRGRPWSSNAIRLRVRWLRKKLKLHKDENGENVVAYTMRHTHATWAAAAGVRDRLLAELMGHTTTRTTARYQHLQVEHLQAAMRLLEKAKGRGRLAG